MNPSDAQIYHTEFPGDEYTRFIFSLQYEIIESQCSVFSSNRNMNRVESDITTKVPSGYKFGESGLKSVRET